MQRQGSGLPRVIVSALRGGSGKTLLSIGIIAALQRLDRRIAPFKKGPDYIDAGWLALAAGRPCHNLDTFLVPPKDTLHAFLSYGRQSDIAIVEGNRGLYDGADTQGSTSTAALAKLLRAPVLLCIDCTKATRTIAALVLGCLHYDPDVWIGGILLNRIAGSRHEAIVRACIADCCDVPVIGSIPKLGEQHFPERHMGLVPTPEHAWARESVSAAAEVVERHVDLDAIETIAESAGALEPLGPAQKAPAPLPDDETAKEGDRPRVGIFRDAAFSFYYPENIEALVSAGAEPVFVHPMETIRMPPVDALYIGGGFPETHARELAEKLQFREELKALAEDGLPVYAECGGLLFLSDALVVEGETYPMAGVFPVVFGISGKPQGHGYTVVRVTRENPYYDVETEIRGHEFHYSKVLSWKGTPADLVFDMKRGTGFLDRRDGLSYKRVLATFTHVHALGTPAWAKALVRNARSYKQR